MPQFNVQHSLAELGAPYSLPCQPSPVAAPQWLAFNANLALQLCLPQDYWHSDTGLALFSGNQVPDWASPLAHAYAGHQFGHFVPQLGDGRALLLAEVIAGDLQRYDIQLKGAGRTPFSRRGDGRSPLGPVLREYLVSEAMHALGVPTTRALAAVLTGDWLQRDSAQPGAVLTRVAKSHIRIGSFQFLAAQGSKEQLRIFADYVIKRHYPHCAAAAEPYLALLAAVVEAQAKLIAHWMSLGFIHGVMNTDNMSIAGETIDYGPCAFMDSFNPAQVFSFIDSQGRYAWANQPRIGNWNLARFAETLLPLLSGSPEQAVERVTEVLHGFTGQNEAEFLRLMAAKIGVITVSTADEPLIKDLLSLMSAKGADFSQTFRLLSQSVSNSNSGAALLFTNSELWQSWALRWQARLTQQGIAPAAVQLQMDQTNPALIPRNHLIAEAIRQASEQADLSLFNRLHQALATPFTLPPDNANFALQPEPQQQIKNTFCGT